VCGLGHLRALELKGAKEAEKV